MRGRIIACCDKNTILSYILSQTPQSSLKNCLASFAEVLMRVLLKEGLSSSDCHNLEVCGVKGIYLVQKARGANGFQFKRFVVSKLFGARGFRCKSVLV